MDSSIKRSDDGPDTVCFVGLASNVSAEQNLTAALAKLAQFFHFDASPAFRTPPYFPADATDTLAAGDFINLVIRFDTDWPLSRLLTVLKQVELALGKDLAAPRFADKVIDLDLLYFGNQVVRHDRLQLPPSTMPFYYLVPLFELAPDWLDAARQQSVADIYAARNASEHNFLPVTLPAVSESEDSQTALDGPALQGSSAHLSLERLRLRVHLGVPAAERAHRQDVFVSLQLDFEQPPRTCADDDVAGSVNYSTVARYLRAVVEATEFHTIEHLAQFCIDTCLAAVQGVSRITAAVHKYPQVPGLEGGAVFTLSQEVCN
ncbi:MAG: 2-amino-4-hydroxy-6-hydroxymethyldihydropteridine diphosphokinase [Pseudomonadota bacterium]